MDASSIYVEITALNLAAGLLHGATGDAGDAASKASGLGDQMGSFGTEPIAATYFEMAGRAKSAMIAIEAVLGSMASNLDEAAAGYVRTDKGLVPTGLAEM